MKIRITKPFVLLILLFLFIHLTARSQVTVSVTPPISYGACQDNLYKVKISNGNTLSQTLAISDSFSVGSPGCSTSSLRAEFILGAPAPTAGISNVFEGDSLRFTIAANSTDSFYYHAYIDCHVIQDSLSSTTVNFFQVFRGSASVNTLPTYIHTSSNISYPFIMEIDPGNNMNGYYLTESDFVFKYTNTKLTPACMRFFFHADTSNYCHQLTTDSITYQIGTFGDTTLYNSLLGDTITLNHNDTLYIHQQVTVGSCLNACSRDTAISIGYVIIPLQFPMISVQHVNMNIFIFMM